MNKRQKKKYGLQKFKPSDIYNLDMTLAKYILPRLKAFRKVNVCSYPSNLDNIDEWHNIIDKMIWSFERVINDDWDEEIDIIDDSILEARERMKQNMEKYSEGMNLFAMYFSSLWD